MAEIDVSDILTDPDFTDPVTLIDRVSRPNDRGENTIFEVKHETIGSVQPASGRALIRVPEDMRVENMSSFWIKGIIVATAPGKYSSILVFQGRRYEVQHVFDWSNFGEGFTEGICVAEKVA